MSSIPFLSSSSAPVSVPAPAPAPVPVVPVVPVPVAAVKAVVKKRVAKPKKAEMERGKMVKGKSIGTFTFCECAENHAGMQQIGVKGVKGSGFSVAELVAIQAERTRLGDTAEVIPLGGAEFPAEGFPEAAVLVIRGGVNVLLKSAEGANTLFDEHAALEHDTKALMRGRVVEKRARGNLCYAEEAQEPDYPAGKGRIVAYDAIPRTAALREALPLYFGEKARDLKCEGNYYYDPEQCGIGFHGDSERTRVIAARVGGSMPLHFQWFQRFKPVGPSIVIPLHDGDMYVMSEKAVGTDWKSSSILTLRHATGGEAYTTIVEKEAPKAPKAGAAAAAAAAAAEPVKKPKAAHRAKKEATVATVAKE